MTFRNMVDGPRNRPRVFAGWVVIAWPVFLATSQCVFAQHVIYVDARAVEAGDGSSWADAYADLQDALDEARAVAQAMPVEVWVAAGTYRADRGTGDRTMSFELASNVAIYGGFSGDEDCLEQRDWQAFETILSGDLLENDDPMIEIDSPCCWGTVASDCDNDACVAAVCEANEFCEVPQIAYFGTIARGLCGDLCRPTFTDNSIQVVRAIDTDQTCVLDGLTIRDGEALNHSERYRWGNAGLFVQHGGILVRNCTFVDNRAGAGANGTVGAEEGQTTQFVNCRFLGPDVLPPFDTIETHLFTIGGDIDVIFDGCEFRDLAGASIGSTNDGLVEFRDCRFVGHGDISDGLAIWLYGGACLMKRCVFEQNDAGIWISSGTQLSLVNCVFRDNRPPSNLIDGFMASAVAENCLFVGNQPMGGVVGGLSYLRLVNSTVASNRTLATATVLMNSRLVFESTALWGNNSFTYPDEGEWNQFDARFVEQPPSINHCLIEGWTGDYGGEGNSGADPMFIAPGHWEDPAGTPDDWTDDIWVDGDYHLSPGSPAINGGDPSIDWHPWATDLDGHPQELCGEADIGAYEFGIGDADCDQAVTLYDSAYWESCLTGPPLDNDPWDEEPILSDACKALDFNADNHVDLSDFARYTLIVQD